MTTTAPTTTKSGIADGAIRKDEDATLDRAVPATNGRVVAETSGNESEKVVSDGSRTVGSGGAAEREEEGTEPVTTTPKKKDSALERAWKAVGLDVGTAMIMFKGSLPPIIAIAMYQAPAVAKVYGSLGYLVPIISMLSLCILPRAKYIQTLILNIIGICIGSSIALLGIWSAIQARNHTASHPSKAYNSSQSAVCAIWLFASIWFVNVLRAKVPALQFPAIMYSIFTNVAFTYGPLFQTVEQGEALVKQLLIAFLTAMAISTGVSLLIIPITSRTVVFKEMTAYIGAVRGAIKAQSGYLQSLEKSDMFGQDTAETGGEGKIRKDKKPKKSKDGLPGTPESRALKAAVQGLRTLHGKLHGDITFGKREAAWGKLDAKNLEEIFQKFQAILIPLIGMTTITDIFERVAVKRGWAETTDKSLFDSEEAWEQDPDVRSRLEEKRVWNEIMKQLHEPFQVVSQHMDDGLQHVGLVLELIKPPKAKKGSKPADAEDVEAKGDALLPGDDKFGDSLDQQMKKFYSERGAVLRAWASAKGLTAEEFDLESLPPTDESSIQKNQLKHREDQQQLYLILYMEHLLWCTGTAILAFIRFADGKKADGSMAKNRLITPGFPRIKKWILNLHNEDSTVDEISPDSMETNQNTIYMGSGFQKKKDPEHLPPRNVWEKFGNGVRTIPRFLGSVESAFGFRCACATMTVGIVAYLEDTQAFFVKQRLVWAMIIIAIGMTITAGQSVFGFFCRVSGTAISMILCIIVWYIVDSKVPGVIVMLWFFIVLEMYFFIKFPRFIGVWLICIVTQILILGYELQVGVIGIKAASASGQPYYPVYELAPYRLATVAGGSFVAFIWTIFPYPITDRSWLRKDLGRTIYLLANYYSIVHSTVRSRIRNTEGDLTDKKSPGYKLDKIRRKIFGKMMLILPSLLQHAEWQKWEVGLGGRFPREVYEDIIQRIVNIGSYMSLITYATETWTKTAHPPASSTPSTPPASLPPTTTTTSNSTWLADLSALVNTIEPTSHAITSTLALLSASVTNGQSLPPYLQLPQPYALNRRLEELDRQMGHSGTEGILSAKHVEEPGYSAYAVVQVASWAVGEDLAALVGDVRGLVGEVDFGWSVGGSDKDSGGGESYSGSGKGKMD